MIFNINIVDFHSLAQWNMVLDMSSLIAAAGVNQGHEASDNAAGSINDIRTLQYIVSRFRAANIDQTEFACLKAILLFKPGKCPLPWTSELCFG